MSKKTETIEIRVSPELKARLQEQSRDAGQTMSGFLRARIDADESGRAPMSKTGALTMTKMTKRIAVAGLPALAVAGIYALAVPAVAVANPDARVAFAEMDLNGDGVITLDEYQGLMMDQSELEALEGDDGSAESAEAEAEGALEIALPESCEAEIASLDLDPMELAELEMAALDINGDGGITFDELNGVMKREAAEEFLEMDIDGDGYLSAAELVDFDGGDDLGDAEEVLSDACIDALAEIMPEDAVIDGESMADALADAGAEEAVAEEVVAEEGTEEPMADEGVEDLLADEGSLEEIFSLGEDGVELDEDYMGRIIVAEYDTDGDGRVSLIEYLGD